MCAVANKTINDPKAFAMKLRRRSFTWFNYTAEDVEYLKAMPAEKADYVCFGFEVTTEGKPHLQGYVEVSTPISGQATVMRLAKGRKLCPGLTVLKLIKDNRDVQINYCRKEDSTDEAAVAVWGSKFIEVTNKGKAPGKRTDWHELHDMCVDGKTFSEVAEVFPEHAIKYHGGIDRLMRGAEEARQMADFKATMEDVELRPWQRRVEKILSRPVDPRKVYWVYDTVGGMGKSWFAKYLVARMGAARFPNCRTQDLAMAYKGEGIVAFDFTRTVEERLNYSVMESIKDGEIFSSKYESRVKRFGSPHVVCFANWMPNQGTMSADRWRIIDLADKKWHKTPKSEAPIVDGEIPWLDELLSDEESSTDESAEQDSADLGGPCANSAEEDRVNAGADELYALLGGNPSHQEDNVAEVDDSARVRTEPGETPVQVAHPPCSNPDERGRTMARAIGKPRAGPPSPGGLLPRNNVPCGDYRAADPSGEESEGTEEDGNEWLIDWLSDEWTDESGSGSEEGYSYGGVRDPGVVAGLTQVITSKGVSVWEKGVQLLNNAGVKVA